MKIIRMASQKPLGNLPNNPARALALGNFDGLHLGHQAILQKTVKEAHEQDLQATMLSFNPHPKKFFDSKYQFLPLSDIRERYKWLKSWGLDEWCLYRFNKLLASMEAYDFFKLVLREQLNGQFFAVGEDFRFGYKRQGNVELLKKWSEAEGARVFVLPEYSINNRCVRSSAIREALSLGDLASANESLGRPFAITGRVIKGQQLGRQLGFPTANIALSSQYAKLEGVYAVTVSDYQKQLIDKPGVASIGYRPSVSKEHALWLEVYLFDYTGDLYDKRLRVSFHDNIRMGQIKFDGLETLTEQIRHDTQAARQYFNEYFK